MSRTLTQRIATSCLHLAGVAILCLALPIWGQEVIDPVEDLRQALRIEDVRNPTPEQLDFRRKNLSRKISNLKTIGDLRKALALDEWKEEPEQGRNEEIRKIDEQMRRLVGHAKYEPTSSALPTGRLSFAGIRPMAAAAAR